MNSAWAFRLLGALAVLCAFLSLRARRLLYSAIWLAAASASVSAILYLLGAKYAAVVELSVGAGLVTVLFAFAINVAGETAPEQRALISRPLAALLVIVPISLLAIFALPMSEFRGNIEGGIFTAHLWQERGIDVLIQLVLVFSGVLGILGLLAEAKGPLEQPAAEEVAAQREMDLQAIERQTARWTEESQQ